MTGRKKKNLNHHSRDRVLSHEGGKLVDADFLSLKKWKNNDQIVLPNLWHFCHFPTSAPEKGEKYLAAVICDFP